MSGPARAAVAAPLWRRALAIAYDWVLLLALLFVATLALLPFSGGERIEPSLAYQLYLLTLVTLYFAGHWCWLGRTPGMRAWRLRVETEAGERPDWRAALLRFASAALAGAPLGAGFLVQRTWHDRISHTRLMCYPRQPRT